MPIKELPEHDLMPTDTTRVYVVAYIDEQGGGFDYEHGRIAASRITHEDLGVGPDAQLYRYECVMPFGSNIRERIADTFFEYIEGQIAAEKKQQ
jgi:hypothetical protein